MKFTFKTSTKPSEVFEADSYEAARKLAVKHFKTNRVFQAKRFYLVDINAKTL